MLEKFKNTKKLWQSIDVLLIILALVASFFAYRTIVNYYNRSDEELQKYLEQKVEEVTGETVEKCENCVRRELDGLYVQNEDYSYYPYATIIENQVDARPQSGLSKARIVFEAEAEGGITRFLAFFDSNQRIDKIGPIRSIRPYFVDWSKELSALLVHVGGSPEALVKVSRESVNNMNEFYNGPYFWRADDRSAPHNVYISINSINKYIEKRGLKDAKFLSWEFKDDASVYDRGTTTSVRVNFRLPDYRVLWEFDENENNYTRYISNRLHLDFDGSRIQAKNIAIAVTPAEVIDSVLRLKMEHIGDGEAVVCFDGYCNEAIWVKQSSSSRIRFYDLNDNEIVFNAGTTWVEVVRPEVEVSY